MKISKNFFLIFKHLNFRAKNKILLIFLAYFFLIFAPKLIYFDVSYFVNKILKIFFLFFLFDISQNLNYQFFMGVFYVLNYRELRSFDSSDCSALLAPWW